MTSALVKFWVTFGMIWLKTGLVWMRVGMFIHTRRAKA
jgi:hypothetical protein